MVVDASAVVDLLLGNERGRRVLEYLKDEPDGDFCAPDLLDVEVVQAFRRLAGNHGVPEARAAGALELLTRLPIDRRTTGPLTPRMWALRHNLTAYDAAYVALAETLECPLLTCDGALKRAAGHRARVILIGPTPAG